MKSISILLLIVGVLVAPAASPGLLQPGKDFPAWTLTDHRGQPVSSKELAGKTYVLWFYPKAMTPGCTVEGRKFRDRSADFRAAGIEIFGVSFDTPEANAEFVEAEEFPFRLLSDRDHSFAAAVGAVRSSEQPVPNRVSYLIGPDGTVLRAYDSVDPGEHADEVLRDATAKH